MKGCRNHHNDSDQQGHIGPLDAMFGGHDTCAPLSHACWQLSAAPRIRPYFLLPRFDRGVGSSIHRICRQPVQSFLAGFENQQVPPGEAF